MTTRISTLAVALLVALLTGCASNDHLSQQMSSWQDQNVAVALNDWGTPDRQEVLGGQTLFVWIDRSAASVDYLSGWGSAVICTRTLATDDAGVIKGWRWRGDACPTLSPSTVRSGLAAIH